MSDVNYTTPANPYAEPGEEHLWSYDPQENMWIKRRSDDEEAKKKLIETIAQQTLAEEATTGQPSIEKRQVLGALDQGDSPDPAVTPIAPSVPEPEPALNLLYELNPPQTLDEIQEAAQPQPTERVPLSNGMVWLPDSEISKPPSAVERLKELGNQAAEPVRQFASKAVSSVTATPRDILGLLTKATAQGLRKTGMNTDALENFGESFNYTANQDREAIRSLIGAKEEKDLNPVERLAGLAGDSITPIKGAGILKPSAIMTGGKFAVTETLTPAQAAKKKNDDEQRILDAERAVETIGGPAKVQNSELMLLGGMAAVSLGAIFAPTLFSKFKTARLPRLRPVEDAAPGTKAMSTPVDLARTYDDVNAGALRLARRSGISEQAANELEKTFQMQTRSAARSIADSAVVTGRAETPAFKFQAKVALADLARSETPQVAQYLHLRDTIDDLMLAGTKQSQLSKQKQATLGPPTVRGYQLQQALTELGMLERSNPQLKMLSKAYQDNLKAMRKFESTGEYATLSKEDMAKLNAERSNMVPFRGQRVMGEAVERGSPFQSLADEMQTNLRHRMENEAVGLYIDTVRKAQPDLFKRVTHADIKDNPHWKKNTVTMYRRGKPETYSTDPFLADVLKLDPYYMSASAQNTIFASKRLLEIGSTGLLAPWFAVTSALRSWQISKYTAGPYKSATLLGTAAAVPQQLYPQVARAISSSLDRGSGGWLRAVMGDAQVNAMSLRLAKAYDDSLYAQMRSVGTHEGSVLEQQVVANNALKKAIGQMQGPMKDAYRGYSALLEAVHNAPAFNFARRNQKAIPKTELAMMARHLTGDPRIGGQYLGGSGRPIRFETDNRVSHTVGKIAKGYGFATEVARTSFPWFNVTTQGMKRIGEAYLQNPGKFIARTYLYAQAPAATAYLLARVADKDPNGVSYTDYMMNRRSAYQKLMNYYIAIPGRPAEEGIELPRFHELAIASHLTEVALDHALRSAIFKESEDLGHAASAFGSAALVPPMPPVINMTLATQGIVGPQGIYGGEAYKKKVDPYDQTGGLPSSIELFTRAVAGGIADVVGAGAASFTQTEGNVLKKIGNFAKDAGKRIVTKTPIVRDVLGIRAPVTGNTEITDELFTNQRQIDQLLRYIQKTTGEEVDTKGASKTGEVIANKMLGPPLPNQTAGIAQPEPTNPLYRLFAQEVANKFKKDAPRDGKGKEQGGVGFRSLWRRYGDATEHLNRIRPINSGNYVTWQRQLEQRPEQLAYLKEHNIDYKNPAAVRNHYEKVRQDASRAILFTIRSVEDQFSQQVGKPVKLRDLDPYGKGLKGEDMSTSGTY